MRDALDANTGALKPVGGTLAMLRVEKPVNIRDALLGNVLCSPVLYTVACVCQSHKTGKGALDGGYGGYKTTKLN